MTFFKMNIDVRIMKCCCLCKHRPSGRCRDKHEEEKDVNVIFHIDIELIKSQLQSNFFEGR